jgi:hypothetical protein
MEELHRHDQQRCRELLGQLNAYIDGELDVELCRDLMRHMAGCVDCRVVFDTLSKTIALYQKLDDTPEALPAQIEARLLRRLKLGET